MRRKSSRSDEFSVDELAAAEAEIDEFLYGPDWSRFLPQEDLLPEAESEDIPLLEGTVMSQHIEKGDLVRAPNGIRSFWFGPYLVTPGKVGVVETVGPESGDMVRVQFLYRSLAVARSKLQLVHKMSPDQLEIRDGDLVRVADGIEPFFHWGKVKKGEIGLVSYLDLDSTRAEVHFPSQHSWQTYAYELELVERWNPYECDLSVGDLVRVKHGIEPIFGWGSRLKRGEVGLVASYDPYTARVSVDFPSCNGWRTCAQELELVQKWLPAICDIQVNDYVRIVPDLFGDRPLYQWGRANKSSVGQVIFIDLDKAKAIVNFPSHSGWKACLQELEKVT